MKTDLSPEQIRSYRDQGFLVIEHFLDILIETERHAEGAPLTSPQRGDLEASLRYFAVAAPKHTADEEQSLFPRLRAVSDPAVTHALELLERDHDEAEQLHATVDHTEGLKLLQ